MKIITIPPQSQPAAAQPAADRSVLAALSRAAKATGADFGYLLQTAMRESSLNPDAQARTSSASGLFQFIEQTWLRTIKKHGAEHGLGAYADAIQMGTNGRFEIADPGMRREILALRKNPEVAATMAGEMTNEVREAMETALGRAVTAGELYTAHFMGLKGAIKLITAAEAQPNAAAATLFPEAAQANRGIFYTKDGEARSLAFVMQSLTAKHDGVLPPQKTGPTVYAAAADGAAPAALHGSISETPLAPVSAPGPRLASTMVDAAFIMSPMMVQLLAALDPMPMLAPDPLEAASILRRSANRSQGGGP